MDGVETYKRVGEVELKLHIFNPKGHEVGDQRPVIVFFFGGGWVGGDPKQFFRYARDFAEMGFVGISAEHRVKKKHGATPFDCVEDGKSAIRWVRENAKKLGVNVNQVVAAGGSAGGHVAACSGVIEGYEGKGENVEVSSQPNAMVLFNPVIDTTERGFGMLKVGKANKEKVSPCHHIRAGLPPTLLLHGKADRVVPHENVVRFQKLMVGAGNVCELESFEGAGHGFFNDATFRPSNGDRNYQLCLKRASKFLRGLGYVGQSDKGK